MIVKVGTRKSQLALTQTKQVVALLEKANPDVTFELVTYQTTGDRLATASLQEIGGKGIFVKDIEQGLIDNQIDIAIHSMKDVPAILPDTCVIGAVPKREDVRDCLIFKEAGMTLETLPAGAVVGTSSLRRQVQLQAQRPDLTIKALRGNIDTRIQKVLDGEYDAIVLAMAGLSRMGWLDKELNIEPLSVDVCLPAIAQGALAIECRKDDTAILEIISRIHDEDTAACVAIERAFLKEMNGNCTFPIGAHAQKSEQAYTLTSMLANQDMTDCFYDVQTGQADQLAKQAASALDRQGAYGREQRPLVVFTREHALEPDWCERLDKHGYDVIHAPLIKCEELPLPKEVEPELAKAEWVLFTSAVSAEYFLPYMKNYQFKIATIGIQTTEAVLELGYHIDFQATSSYAADFSKEWLEKVQTNGRILLPQSSLASPLMENTLLKDGHDLCAWTMYDTVSNEVGQAVCQDVMAKETTRKIIWTFASTSGWESFYEVIKEIPARHKVAVIGTTTQGSVEKDGIHVDYRPDVPTIPDMLDVILEQDK